VGLNGNSQVAASPWQCLACASWNPPHQLRCEVCGVAAAGPATAATTPERVPPVHLSSRELDSDLDAATAVRRSVARPFEAVGLSASEPPSEPRVPPLPESPPAAGSTAMMAIPQITTSDPQGAAVDEARHATTGRLWILTVIALAFLTLVAIGVGLGVLLTPT